LNNPDHKIYPYLLRDVKIEYPNQVWATDITYIKMAEGFMYLVGLLDLYSRFIVSWRFSNTLDTSFCLDMLNQGLVYGSPDILNKIKDANSQVLHGLNVWKKMVKVWMDVDVG
jgi:putative transposase